MQSEPERWLHGFEVGLKGGSIPREYRSDVDFVGGFSTGARERIDHIILGLPQSPDLAELKAARVAIDSPIDRVR